MDFIQSFINDFGICGEALLVAAVLAFGFSLIVKESHSEDDKGPKN